MDCATADDFDGPSVWAILTGAVFWLAVPVVIVFAARGLLKAIRSRR